MYILFAGRFGLRVYDLDAFTQSRSTTKAQLRVGINRTEIPR